MGFIITMENNTLKRDLVKYCRDRAKHAYKKKPLCEICDSDGNGKPLDLHHYSSMTLMLESWLRKNKLNPTTASEIMAVRDAFIEEHHVQIYEEVVTLCFSCHDLKLHKIYGSKPPLATAKKQMEWVKKQRIKWESKNGS
jgi:hypothetical protein